MAVLTVEKALWIDALPEAVFDALTSSEKIVEYFPLDRVDSSWSVGSELRMYGTVNGNTFTDFGLIQKLQRPNFFAYSYWSDNHGSENLPENHVSIDYSLWPESGGTRLRMLQSNLPSREYAESMGEIWEGLLTSLKAYVESLPN